MTAVQEGRTAIMAMFDASGTSVASGDAGVVLSHMTEEKEEMILAEWRAIVHDMREVRDTLRNEVELTERGVKIQIEGAIQQIEEMKNDMQAYQPATLDSGIKVPTASSLAPGPTRPRVAAKFTFSGF